LSFKIESCGFELSGAAEILGVTGDAFRQLGQGVVSFDEPLDQINFCAGQGFVAIAFEGSRQIAKRDGTRPVRQGQPSYLELILVTAYESAHRPISRA